MYSTEANSNIDHFRNKKWPAQNDVESTIYCLG